VQDEPSEEVETEQSEPLSITAQEGMDGVQQILDLEPFSIDVLIDSYLWLMSEGDSTCPGGGTDLTGVVPVEGCTSESGLTYLGVSTYIDLAQEFEEDAIQGFILNADMEIIDADGHSFEGGGFSTIHRENLGPDLPMLGIMGIGGTWRYPAAEGALGEGISGEYLAFLLIENGSWSLALDGALSVGSNAVYFDDLVYGGEPCTEGLTGALGLRSPEGRWIRVEMGEDCDLCGQATRVLSGEDLGEACLDNTSSLDLAVEDLWP
jgi:hypothetical protein